MLLLSAHPCPPHAMYAPGSRLIWMLLLRSHCRGRLCAHSRPGHPPGCSLMGNGLKIRSKLATSGHGLADHQGKWRPEREKVPAATV